MELGERTLEPAAPFRFLNHSCQPNCALVLDEEEEEAEDGTPAGASLWLEVLREIPAGEQLTIDYGWPAESAIPCKCGAARCRGWIVTEAGLGAVASARQGSLATC